VWLELTGERIRGRGRTESSRLVDSLAKLGGTWQKQHARDLDFGGMNVIPGGTQVFSENKSGGNLSVHIKLILLGATMYIQLK
jgi:hypothetical protein